MHPPFSLRELRYFVAVVEQGDVARAAGSLRVAEPALSHAVAKLEARLEAELLERGACGLAPTAAGLAFYEKARAAVSSADDAVASVGPWARGEKRLLLGYPPSAQALARTLRRSFIQRNRDVEIGTVHAGGGELLAALRAGGIDVAITYPRPPGRDLTTAPLIVSPRYAVLPEHHPLAGRAVLRPAEIAGSVLAGEREAITGRPCDSTPSVGLDGLWALVCSGRAIGVLPRFMLSAAVGDGVRAIPLAEVAPLEVVLVRRRDDERDAMGALFGLVERAAETIPAPLVAA